MRVVNSQVLQVALLSALLAGLLRPAAALGTFKLGNQTHGWVELISWKPRAFLYHGFLSHEECDHIIKVASPSLERSTVVGKDGSSVLDNVRTSSGMFIRKRSDPIISAVEDRVAAATHLPNVNHEDMQVLKYELGQEYTAHWDINDSKERQELMKKRGMQGGLRTATLLMYLSDVEEGGETSFPNGRWLNEEVQAQPPYSECASKGVAVKAKKGDAILFYSLKLNALAKDPYSLHAGCPVIKGTKYSATKWIHVEAFGYGKVQPPKECTDERSECAEWARAGECDRNPDFMRGSTSAVGQCRRSCKVCRVCQPGDVLCERENERALD